MATEIATLKVKDSFRPEDMQKPLEYFKPLKGLQSYRWGRVVTDPNTVIFILHWDSVADHEVFMNAENYPAFIETFKPFLIGPNGLSLYHAYLQPFPPTKLFEAENIELTAVTKRPDVSLDKFEATRDKLLQAVSKAPGYDSHFYGVQHEDENIYVEMIGWDSVESHTRFITSTPDVVSARAATIILEQSSSLDVKLHPAAE